MNDFVGFEPNRLDRLAKNLQRLAEALDGNLDQIRSIVESAGGHVTGSSKTRYWMNAAHDDANDMAFRAQRAWEAYRREQQRPPFIGPVAHPGTVALNWSETSQGGRQALSDAAGFNGAQHEKNIKLSRSRLKLLAQSLRDHAGDKDYLRTFWSNVDPGMAARLARLLHDQDVASGYGREGKSFALSNESRRILANVAAGLVALRDHHLSLPQSVRKAMVDPPGDDLWSSIMLTKFGPSGDRWDPELLAAMGRRQLYRIDERGIYRDLDPMRAILSRIGDSGAASRLLLGDKDNGVADTGMLMRVAAEYNKTHFNGAQGVDDVAGRVLLSATRVRPGLGEEARQAVQAVANLISASHQWVADGPKLHLELTASVRSAMTKIAALYLPDFAASADNPTPGVHVLSEGRPWHLLISHDLLKEYMSQAVRNPADLGWIKGKAKAYVSVATAMSATASGAGSYVEDAAGFLGLLQAVDSAQRISKGHEKDVAANAAKGMFDTLNDLAGLIPGEKLASLAAEAGYRAAGKGVAQVFARTGDARTLASLFMKEDPSAEEQARINAQSASSRERFGISALILEGLIRAGKLKPPSDPEAYRNGHIIPGPHLENWYRDQRGEAINIDVLDQNRRKKVMVRTVREYVDRLRGNFGSVEGWV